MSSDEEPPPPPPRRFSTPEPDLEPLLDADMSGFPRIFESGTLTTETLFQVKRYRLIRSGLLRQTHRRIIGSRIRTAKKTRSNGSLMVMPTKPGKIMVLYTGCVVNVRTFFYVSSSLLLIQYLFLVGSGKTFLTCVTLWPAACS
jgi:hypothetical protein